MLDSEVPDGTAGDGKGGDRLPFRCRFEFDETGPAVSPLPEFVVPRREQLADPPIAAALKALLAHTES